MVSTVIKVLLLARAVVALIYNAALLTAENYGSFARSQTPIAICQNTIVQTF